MNGSMNNGRPLMAIVNSNMLATIGLKQLLQHVMPIITIETFASFEELESNNADRFFHYFVETSIVLAHRQFFIERRRHTIVLTISDDPDKQLSEFHGLCINQPEKELIKDLLLLVLSDREIEVLALICQGLINKEIADRLNISMTTVITHRKNITEKLGLKSVSALTIYAVMHGYVDIDKI